MSMEENPKLILKSNHKFTPREEIWKRCDQN